MQQFDENMKPLSSQDGLSWYDGKSLTIEGKGWLDTAGPFHRLPQRAENVVRKEVWELSKCSAGICLRFHSNSSKLSLRWDGNQAMNHMPATGVSGIDVYTVHEGHWRWLAIARPTSEENESAVLTELPRENREYILYLPLYYALRHIEIGIEKDAWLKASLPRTEKPIVFYGTSITQGGCASRPGMCYSAILGRKLQKPVINLGFSGNGKQEKEVIELVAELDASLFVLDNLPNMTADLIEERLANALWLIRDKHPDTPIVVLDSIQYCDDFLVTSRKERYVKSNQVQKNIINELKEKGFANLFLIEDNGFIGHDGEATVDGTHLTDLGYMRLADYLYPHLKKILS